MEKWHLCFYSGTGNSRRVAKNSQAILEKSGCLVKISQIQRGVKIGPEREENLAVLYPTHGFMAPWRVFINILRMARGKGEKTVVIATQAGLQFGRVFIPGLSGLSTFIIALILLLKNYRVSGVTSIDMPSNWMALHPAQKEKALLTIISRSQKRIDKFMGRILNGKFYWLNWVNFYEVILGLLVFPISILYLLIGRFFLGQIFHADNNCTGCGLCEKYCPNQAISMKNGRPAWNLRCESCMRCMGFCPEKAIQVNYLWAVALWWLVRTVQLWIFPVYKTSTGIEKAVGFLVTLPVVYGMLYLSQRLLNWLTRWKFINSFLTFTAPTRYYRRYREPGSKLKDLYDWRKDG